MLERLKLAVKEALQAAQLKNIFVEDAYRLQTVIDDHMRRMEVLEAAAKELVAELEGK